MAAGRRWTVGVVLLVSVLAWLFLVSPLVELGLPLALAGLLVVGVASWVGLRHRARSNADDDAHAGAVWDAIPSWQYDGRHVESGGLTRDEQEQALQDVQDEAEELRGRT